MFINTLNIISKRDGEINLNLIMTRISILKLFEIPEDFGVNYSLVFVFKDYTIFRNR